MIWVIVSTDSCCVEFSAPPLASMEPLQGFARRRREAAVVEGEVRERGVNGGERPATVGGPEGGLAADFADSADFVEPGGAAACEVRRGSGRPGRGKANRK